MISVCGDPSITRQGVDWPILSSSQVVGWEGLPVLVHVHIGEGLTD